MWFLLLDQHSIMMPFVNITFLVMLCSAVANILVVWMALDTISVAAYVVVPSIRPTTKRIGGQWYRSSWQGSKSTFLHRAVANDNDEGNDGDNNNDDADEIVDVIVVGAGIGGLCCAGLSSKYGFNTVCLEAHDTPGGVAHSFQRYSPTVSKTVPFQFDSGPSLLTGLSSMSTNPLRQVLDALDVVDEVTFHTYDGWLVWDTSDLTIEPLKLTAGSSGYFEGAIEKKAGLSSRKAFEQFKNEILTVGGLAEVSAYIPPFALRGSANIWSSLRSIAPYIIKILTIGTKGLLLTGPFTKTMDLYGMTDPFIRKWFDYLAFALSGVDASNTQGAPIAYMMSDLHKPGAVLDYPMGGMEALIKALVVGITKHGGEVRLNTRVEKFLLSETDTGSVQCVGVQLSNGRRIKAKRGVVSNAPLWNYAKILKDSIEQPPEDDSSTDNNGRSSSSRKIEEVVSMIQKQADDMSMTRSFMHLHLGIPKDGLPDDLECHHSVLNFDLPVTDEQNMSIISIPTIFDPTLAPEGYHIVHAYTAASDNFDEWLPFQEETGKVGTSPNSSKSRTYNQLEGYDDLKIQKAEALWKAVECVIPDIRERASRKGSVVLVGSPLTHRRYNQRFRGTYGPGVNPGKDVWELAGATTPIKGLYACGDTR
jgi:phytoene dehydrogenase-like protein